MSIINNFFPAKSFRMDCYRHALIPIIHHFNKNWEIFMLFPLNHFSFENRLECREFGNVKINHMLLDVGIKRDFVNVSDEDFIDFICYSIDNEQPIIVYIDSYYNPSFPSIYMKYHSQHCIPVYGYDRQKKEFNIIDSDYMEDFSRKQRIMSFQDLKNCFLSYIKQYNSTGNIQRFSAIPSKCKQPKEKYINILRNIYFDQSDPLQKYHHEFEKFCEYFERIYSDRKVVLKSCDLFYMAFNKMINFKHMEYIGYQSILIDYEKINEIIEELIEKYNYVRAIFFKTHYSQKYKEESFYNCSKAMWDICNLEKTYISTLKQNLNGNNLNYSEGMSYEE